MAFRGSSFQNFSGRIPLNLPHRAHLQPSYVHPPPPPSLCIMNFIVQIIVLSWPSKPGNTDSVSQNFKNLGKHIPGLPHFRVCAPHFLERIVALGRHAIKVSFENETNTLLV